MPPQPQSKDGRSLGPGMQQPRLTQGRWLGQTAEAVALRDPWTQAFLGIPPSWPQKQRRCAAPPAAAKGQAD